MNSDFFLELKITVKIEEFETLAFRKIIVFIKYFAPVNRQE